MPLLQLVKRGSDAQKIAYAASFFEVGSPAHSWVLPHLPRVIKNDPSLEPWLLGWSAFTDQLVSLFGNPRATADNLMKLQNLSQTASARDYTIKFNELASRTDISNQTQMILYEQKLKTDVRSRLAGNKNLTTLAALQAAATDVDD